MAAVGGQALRNDYEFQVRGWLDLKMVTGRYSSVLVNQLVRHMEQGTANVFAIYDEVEALERPDAPCATRTKKATQLTGTLLCGLWHKHYFQAAFLVRNLRNHWQPEAKMATLNEAVTADTAVTEDVRAGRIAHSIMSGFQAHAEARKVTGEWIVYAKLNGMNCYLTLGNHDEGDAAIAARVEMCEAEFPELQGTWGIP